MRISTSHLRSSTNLMCYIATSPHAGARLCGLMRCSFDGKPGQAIIKLSRRHFERADLAKLLEGVRFEKKQFHNDIYSKASCTLHRFLSKHQTYVEPVGASAK